MDNGGKNGYTGLQFVGSQGGLGATRAFFL